MAKQEDIWGLILIVALLLFACCLAAEKPQCTGCDRDAHGCIGSAGYTWCEAKQTCLRVWEEDCTVKAPATPR